MPSFNSPGTYVVENDLLALSVAEVETAIPAFIGYTEKSTMNTTDVVGQPVRLASLSEFEHVFGRMPSLTYGLKEEVNAQHADVSHPNGFFRLVAPEPDFRLYRSMQLFFNNGGEHCYIVSAGHYADGVIDLVSMQRALDALIGEQAPTIVSIPDAVSLPPADCFDLQQSMLEHCARKTRNRMAILDIHGGFRAINDSVTPFRHHVATTGVGDFGAAYYPWVNTSLVDESALDYTGFDDAARALLQRAIARELGKVTEQTNAVIAALTTDTPPQKGLRRRRYRDRQSSPEHVDNTLRTLSSTYVAAVQAMAKHINLMPPSAAMAGRYAKVDTERGVWKAPANIDLNSVVSPSVPITDVQQQSLNSDPDGKSVNAIRYFTGKGTLVWGARTLAGNDPQWKYISVRRTCIMLEQRIQSAAHAVVFEPNDEPVWSALKQAVSTILMDLWRQGGLAGEKSEQAFFVNCGLGETMTAADVAAGYLIISVGVAMVRPAEFIVLTVQQKMQTP